MPIFSSWGLHAQVSPVILTIIPVRAICVTASEKGVKEIASQGLCTHLIITSIHVYRLLQAESVDSLQTLPLILDLLWVREVTQGQSAVIQGTLLLLGA